VILKHKERRHQENFVLLRVSRLYPTSALGKFIETIRQAGFNARGFDAAALQITASDEGPELTEEDEEILREVWGQEADEEEDP